VSWRPCSAANARTGLGRQQSRTRDLLLVELHVRPHMHVGTHSKNENKTAKEEPQTSWCMCVQRLGGSRQWVERHGDCARLQSLGRHLYLPLHQNTRAQPALAARSQTTSAQNSPLLSLADVAAATEAKARAQRRHRIPPLKQRITQVGQAKSRGTKSAHTDCDGQDAGSSAACRLGRWASRPAAVAADRGGGTEGGWNRHENSAVVGDVERSSLHCLADPREAIQAMHQWQKQTNKHKRL
jgi:hypothetical protein